MAVCVVGADLFPDFISLQLFKLHRHFIRVMNMNILVKDP